MSHNVNKVNSQSPNRQGAITQSVNDLSDVNLSALSPNEVLKYDSGAAEWVNAPAPAGQPSYIWIGGEYANAYSNSPAGATISTGDTLYIYHNGSPVNTIAGATITATNNWVESITLPAGEYIIRGQTMVVFSASGYLAYRFEDASNARLSQYGVVGTSRGVTYGPSNSCAEGYVNLSSQTTIKLVVKALSGADTAANQGNTPSQYGFISIEALS